jgi:hypothetical protein
LDSQPKNSQSVSGLPLNTRKSVLKVDSRLCYLIAHAKRTKHQKYITLTLKEAEDILAFLRKETTDMPDSIRYK